jgi:hypothetical protein
MANIREYRNGDLVALAEELERQKQTKRDYVVDTRTLGAKVIDGVMQITVEGVGDFEPTGFCHKQIAEKCGIPQRFYDELGQKHPELRATNVDVLVKDKERRMIRTLDGKARAIVSDRYRPMDNADVMFLALDKLKQHEARVLRADLSETHLYMKAILPNETLEIGKDDPCQRGIVIRNSEVGAGAFAVEPFLYRLSCANGMIGESAITKVHLGGKHAVGEIFSDLTRTLEDKALWSAVKDVIDATFDPSYFEQWVGKLRVAKETPVMKPVEAIDFVVKEYKLPDESKKALLDYFVSDGLAGVNVYGLANAVTRFAQDQSDYDRQIELERIGARVVENRQLLKVAGVV